MCLQNLSHYVADTCTNASHLLGHYYLIWIRDGAKLLGEDMKNYILVGDLAYQTSV